MANLNLLQIIGNVGRDPEMRYTQAGVPVCTFSVAVTDKWGGKDGSEKKEKTVWVRVTCWRNLAETANAYVRKGMSVYVQGKAEVSSYLDKSGEAAATLELNADSVQFLGGKDHQQERSQEDVAF